MARAAPAPLTILTRCVICSDVRIGTAQTVQLRCRHPYCHSCFRQAIKVAMTYRADFPFVCKVTPQCTLKVVNLLAHRDVLRDMVINGEQLWDRYNRIRFEWTSKHNMTCSNKTCRAHLPDYRLAEHEDFYIHCEQCCSKTCRKCRKPDAQHGVPRREQLIEAISTVPGVTKWEQLTDAVLFNHLQPQCPPDTTIDEVGEYITSGLAQHESGGKCPQCLSGVIKAGGCSHMTCVICRHQYCWTCKKPNWQTCGCYKGEEYDYEEIVEEYERRNAAELNTEQLMNARRHAADLTVAELMDVPLPEVQEPMRAARAPERYPANRRAIPPNDRPLLVDNRTQARAVMHEQATAAPVSDQADLGQLREARAPLRPFGVRIRRPTPARVCGHYVVETERQRGTCNDCENAWGHTHVRRCLYCNSMVCRDCRMDTPYGQWVRRLGRFIAGLSNAPIPRANELQEYLVGILEVDRGETARLNQLFEAHHWNRAERVIRWSFVEVLLDSMDRRRAELPLDEYADPGEEDEVETDSDEEDDDIEKHDGDEADNATRGSL